MARFGEYGIRLADGDDIYLQRLHQERVMHAISMRGYMAFSPTRRPLEHLAEQIAKDVREARRANSPYFYIPPLGVKEHPELTETGFERLKMPQVVCAGVFSRGAPSHVLAVWYQDEFALPIDERVIIKLSRMDWGRYCYDGYVPCSDDNSSFLEDL